LTEQDERSAKMLRTQFARRGKLSLTILSSCGGKGLAWRSIPLEHCTLGELIAAAKQFLPTTVLSEAMNGEKTTHAARADSTASKKTDPKDVSRGKNRANAHLRLRLAGQGHKRSERDGKKSNPNLRGNRSDT